MDIENIAELKAYLVEKGYVDANAPLNVRVLAGGVSNRTVLVEFANGDAWVLKQALAKLRVKADWFSDPARVQREALGMRWLAQFTPEGTIPAFIFQDDAEYLLVMTAVPQPHSNWKHLLLNGEVDEAHVRQFGQILGAIHRQSAENDAVRELFADRQFFETLRLEPYYAYTAEQQPSAAPFLHGLIEETRQQHITLVHGDYSPKNILVHDERLILLDHEVIHFGDPAFDVGFSLTHLLSKAHHVAGKRQAFHDAALLYWQTYQVAVSGASWWAGVEARAVRHTLACLLARVDGRSPLEYLTEAERQSQRRVCLDLMHAPPADMPTLIDAFIQRLNTLGI